MENKLRITSRLSNPMKEFQFRFSRSGGAGGQHVNKVSTRVELVFDVNQSPSLNEPQKGLIVSRLKSRIGIDGRLTMSSQESRSQWRNRELVLQKFADVLSKALKPVALRTDTKPTYTSRQRRLTEKKLDSSKKSNRRKPDIE